MDVRKEQNFFEGRVTEYQKASSLARRRRRGALGHGHRIRRDPAGPRAQARGRVAGSSRRSSLPELGDAPAVRVIGEDGGETPLTAALPAGMVADALAVLAAAERRGGRHRRRARDRARDHRRRARAPGRRRHGHRARPLHARRGGADRRRLLRRRQGARAAPRAADDVDARDRAADPPLAARSRRGARSRSRSRSARRSSRWAWSPRRRSRSRRASASARTRSAPRTCRSRPCRTSSRRSSCSPATCAWPSATSSTAPSGRCCARSEDAAGRAGGDPGSRPTAVRVDRRRPARADRVRVDRARPRARRRRARARAAAGDPSRHRPRRPAAARRAQRQGADGARRRVLALRRPHPAHLRLRGDAGLGHRPRRRSAR